MWNGLNCNFLLAISYSLMCRLYSLTYSVIESVLIIRSICVQIHLIQNTNVTRGEVPEQISAGQRCFRDFINFCADQRCFRMGWENQRWWALFQSCSALDQNEKVLGSRRTCSFGVYQLWKNHSGENSVKN